jgi:hypothetical protein
MLIENQARSAFAVCSIEHTVTGWVGQLSIRLLMRPYSMIEASQTDTETSNGDEAGIPSRGSVLATCLSISKGE